MPIDSFPTIGDWKVYKLTGENATEGIQVRGQLRTEVGPFELPRCGKTVAEVTTWDLSDRRQSGQPLEPYLCHMLVVYAPGSRRIVAESMQGLLREVVDPRDGYIFGPPDGKLEVGLQWELRVRYHDGKTSGGLFHVVARETWDLPAGQFELFRVEGFGESATDLVGKMWLHRECGLLRAQARQVFDGMSLNYTIELEAAGNS